MVKELVNLIKWEARTTSNRIWEEFGIAHKELLRKIHNFRVEISTIDFEAMFRKSTFENSYKRTFDNYSINRDWYMFIVMNIQNKKAHNKKLQFIKAFNQMEKILLQQQNSEWITTRELWKQIRLQATDTIKDFIEYAKKQGASSWVKFYYANLTKAEYKALKLLQHNKPKTRDTLDKMELFHLTVAENMLKGVIVEEMNKWTHYKEIYLLCKIALDNFAGTLYLKTPNLLINEQETKTSKWESRQCNSAT